MLYAIHPDNVSRVPPDSETCVDQGHLLMLLNRSPHDNVILDPLLPGKIRPDDLIKIIEKNYPYTVIGYLEPERKEVTSELVKKARLAFYPLLLEVGSIALLIGVFYGLTIGLANQLKLLKILGYSCSVPLLISCMLCFKGDK